MKNPSEYGVIIRDAYQKAQNNPIFFKELYDNPVKIFKESGMSFYEENNHYLIELVRTDLDRLGDITTQQISCATCKTITNAVIIGTAGLAFLLTTTVTVTNPLVITFTASLSVALGVTLSVSAVTVALNTLIASGTVAFSIITDKICEIAGYC